MFGSMAPMPQMRPNQLLQSGMGILNMAQQQNRAQTPPGQVPQGLLQRLLNPQAPPGAPMDLSAPGMKPNPMQMGLLGRLFPGFGGSALPPGPPAPTTGLY